MRFVIVLLLTLVCGIFIFFGLSMLIGVWIPKIKAPLFCVLSVYWMFLGWRYACIIDNLNRQERDSLEVQKHE